MNRDKDGQRGSVLFLVVLMMVVLLSFCALSIDMGYILLIRTQLQRAADAAALAGAAELPDSAAAISAAQQYANSNMPGQGTILSSSDIVIGTWDPVARTLTATSNNPTAISVKASRTQAKGNPISLFFAPIFGITTSDMSASATAQVTYPRLSYNIIGMNRINITGGATIDSYDSSIGPYSSSHSQHGDIASNGNITINGGSIIYGDSRAGIGKTTSVTGGASVTGSTTSLTKALSYAPAPPPTSYNNHGLGTSLTVQATTLTLVPDTYYFTSLIIKNGGKLSISGPTTIYLSSTISVSGGGIINSMNKATDLSLVFTSTATSGTFSNGATFYGSIYGPNFNLTINGGSSLYGSFVTKSLNISNGGSFHLDKNVQLSFVTPTVKLVK